MNEKITWEISREKAREWGLEDTALMNTQPVCETCKTEAEWIDCPTGGWWAHWEHPDDGHDAEVKLGENNGRAILVGSEHIQSFRYQEEWSMILRDPERDGYWETPFYVGSGGDEDVDRWNNASTITLTMMRRQRVSRIEWTSVRRPADAV